MFAAITKVVKRILRFVVLVLTAALEIVVLASLLDHVDAVPESWPVYGIDFLPPVWLLVPVSLIFALGWLVGSRIAASSLAILYAILLLGFGDLSIPAFRSTTPRGADTLSVVTLNVQYYSYGLQAVLSAVKQMNADVVMLSENNLTTDQMGRVKEYFAPKEFVMGRQNGMAILSRFPILEFREVDLPSQEASLSGGNDVDSMEAHPHKSFIHAVLHIGGVRVNMLSIQFIAGRPKDHSLAEILKWGRYLLGVQRLEVSTFTEYLSRLQGPVIFGGDFNAPPGSKTMRRISRLARDAQLEHHVWGGFTFPTDFPTQRLDYLFSMNGVESLAARRLDVVVSDHYPVYARFIIPDTLHATLTRTDSLR